MGRKRRIWIPNQFVHVVSRGVRRDPLFLDENDHVEAFYMLSDVYEKAPFEMISYCFMTNHFHFLIRTSEQPVSKVMALFNKRYANYFNIKYCFSGYVFESRFHSTPVNDERGILEVSRYIDLNPVKAKMVEYPAEYPWSSYHFYASDIGVPPKYFNQNLILGFFSGAEEEQRKAYREWVSGTRDLPKNVEQPLSV
ncbi:transposase [Bacillus shivajii]|uniref:transposase n=1 Tax=Bacillus shivajii TaxID=1983719 RepID=UPI001CFA3DF0|nr:transposase [Bacillus shivajii]UCZ52829.1 transposase [Bacillus shivajii]